ncbi:unnamed protein product [Porites lobata]|uniref:Transient receptor potential cation channel subfamily A member 1 n=1 Tax=Porites lobata TaxID=104759 RepID=A0ABN8R0I7_9CNID|nr:unnamed protein product [Porites lobata]
MISTQGFSLRQFSEKITHFLDNPDNITDFSRKYLVTEDTIKMYVNHMKLLSVTKEKRSKYKAAQREEARKTYKDYDWEEMFHERSLSQLKVVELDKYVAHHNLGKYGTKKAKLEAIKENIIQELAKRIEREEDGKSNNQSSSDSLRRESEDNSEEEEDCVLAEIGISSSEKEEESTEEEEMIDSTENFNVNTTIVYTQSGRRAT